jgi:hypothetical protein
MTIERPAATDLFTNAPIPVLGSDERSRTEYP